MNNWIPGGAPKHLKVLVGHLCMHLIVAENSWATRWLGRSGWAFLESFMRVLSP